MTPQNPADRYDRLFGDVMLTPSDVWTVGYDLDVLDAPPRPLVERWNGHHWAVLDTPPTKLPNAGFNAVAATSDGDVWAVGEQSDPNGGTVKIRTLVEHWDGAAWTVVPSPDPRGGMWVSLSGVTTSSPGDVWAVGSTVDKLGDERPLAIHWNGYRWRAVPTPGVKKVSRLNQVSAISPSDVWAVGEYTVASGRHTRSLIEHWDGSTWAVMPRPRVALDDTLDGVSGSSASDVWAVGFTDVNSFGLRIPIALHWDGTAWHAVDAPIAGDGSSFGAVVAVSQSSAYAVGFSSAGPSAATLVEHWNGRRWQIVSTPNAPNSLNYLYGVAASVDRVMAVGEYTRPGPDKSRTLAELCCAS